MELLKVVGSWNSNWGIPVAEHGCVLQNVLSLLIPEQARPPLEGAGLLQDLVLVWDPPLQVLLQADQVLQAPQLPSKAKY